MASFLRNRRALLLLILTGGMLIASCELPITPPPAQPTSSLDEGFSPPLPVVVHASDPIGQHLLCDLLERHLTPPSYRCVEPSAAAEVAEIHFDYKLLNPSLDYGRNLGFSSLTAGSLVLVTSSATVTFAISLQAPERPRQAFRLESPGRVGLWFVSAPGKGWFGTSFGTLINSSGGHPAQLQHSCLAPETPLDEQEHACKLYRELLEDSLHRGWSQIEANLHPRRSPGHPPKSSPPQTPSQQTQQTPSHIPVQHSASPSAPAFPVFPWGDKWQLSIYHGQVANNDFLEVLLGGQRDFLPSYLDTLALSRTLSTQLPGLHFEIEGQLGKHSGMQEHWETNLQLVFRWQLSDVPIPVSVAYGDGLSYAEEVPRMELAKGEVDTQRLLAYFMVELDVGLPTLPAEPKLFFRIHHRSGVYGLFCKKKCGSNFPALGLKFTI